MTIPRLALSEFFLELELKRRKHLIVEGQTDARFLGAWLAGRLPERMFLTPVENLEIENEALEALGLHVNHRSRVIYAAREADLGAINVLCIADRDAGHSVNDHKYDRLLWTDFPALESYSLTPEVLDHANKLFFKDKLPVGTELIGLLAPALRDLFAIRLQHEHLQRPNFKAGLGRSLNLTDFTASQAVPEPIRTRSLTYSKPEDRDPRAYAYGHDIAELMMAAFAAVVKKDAGLATVDAIESVLRASFQAVGDPSQHPLFQKVERWVAA